MSEILLFTWFLLVAIMLAGYIVLDGFDLGVGILHLLVARDEQERTILRHTIGPIWDGNEVWLIAGGGTLFFAFPLLYASGFSGFYLPLMIVLWLLILRGIGVELREQLDTPVWRGIFNGCFGIGSLLLAIFFGTALGNVIRGVPLGPDHIFFLPLWTNLRVGPEPGLLDWYTILAGITAAVALAHHGALWATLKISGDLNVLMRRTARMLWPILAALTIASLAATVSIRPDLLGNYNRMPILYVIPIGVAAALAATRGIAAERTAFIASCVYLALMLIGAAAAVYPNLLVSSADPAFNITVHNAHSGQHALTIGLIWWTFGMAIAIGYAVMLYRMFGGKVALPHH